MTVAHIRAVDLDRKRTKLGIKFEGGSDSVCGWIGKGVCDRGEQRMT